MYLRSNSVISYLSSLAISIYLQACGQKGREGKEGEVGADADGRLTFEVIDKIRNVTNRLWMPQPADLPLDSRGTPYCNYFSFWII